MNKRRRRKLIVVDLYCGAGGIDHTLVEYCDEMGYELDLTCINHWDKAIATNRLNHPNAKHLTMNVEEANPRAVVPGGKLDLLVLAPQCIYFTKARGGKPVTDQMRADAWNAMNWLELLDVNTMLLENVPEFEDWGPTKKKKVKRNFHFNLPLLPSFNQFYKKWSVHGGYRSEWKRIYTMLKRKRVRVKAKIQLRVEITIEVPDPDRKGEIFRAWKQAIEAHGYVVKHGVFNSADYGGFTSRKRFFLIARKKTIKRKIKFGLPTHSPTGKTTLVGKTEKYRAAAEILDWTNLGHSIWSRKRPIVPNTWKRVLAGLDKCSGIQFLGVDGDMRPRSADEIAAMLIRKEAGTVGKPFLISLRGTSDGALENTNFPLSMPTPTIMGGNHLYVVNPMVLNIRGGDDGYTRAISTEEPLQSLTTSNPMAVLSPAMTPMILPNEGYYRGNQAKPTSEPLDTITQRGAGAVVQPQLWSFLLGQQSEARPRGVDQPMNSPTTDGAIGLFHSYLMPVHHGDDARTHSVDAPMPSPTTVDGMAVANSFLINIANSGANGSQVRGVDGQVPTITGFGGIGIANPFLMSYHTEKGDGARVQDLGKPLPAQDTSNRHAFTTPFLAQFYGNSIDQPSPVSEPLPSQPTKDKFALVSPIVVKSTDGRIWLFDILMRMLTPKELARAMSFPAEFQFVGSREDAVKMIGNAIEGKVGRMVIHAALT